MFDDCLKNAKKENKVTEKQLKELTDLFGEKRKQYEKIMSESQAAAKAAKEVFDSAAYEAMLKRRQKLLQINAWRSIELKLRNYRNEDGNDIFKGAEALLTPDQFAKYSNVDQRTDAVRGLATAKFNQVLTTFQKNLIGNTRNKATLDDMLNEIFGVNTKNQNAKELAQAWKETAEYLRKRFNAAGGAIPTRKDWGMPQQHDSLEVRKAAPDDWVEFTYDKLNKSKMIDERTNQPFTEEALKRELKNVYTTIATEGMNKVEPSGSAFGKSIANRRTDHRFLVFDGPQAWLAYNQRFGKSDPFDVMTGHIQNMSRDIGLMEVLGPNPKSTLIKLQQYMKKQALEGKVNVPDAVTKAQKTSKTLEGIYGHLMGSYNIATTTIGRGLGSLRQYLTGFQLGSAFISAFTDFNFQRVTRQFNGLPQTSTIKRYFDYIMPLGVKERNEIALAAGLNAEAYLSTSSALMRFNGEVNGSNLSRRVADFTLRASLLSPFTQAGRFAFGMDFMSTLGRNAGKKFNELEKPLRDSLTRYGFSDYKWDLIRKSKLEEVDGVKILRAVDIEGNTKLNEGVRRDLATRYLEMINTETNYAVPSSSVRGQYLLKGTTTPDQLIGNVARSFAMYKNFGVTLLHTHLARGMYMPTAKGRAAYMADFIISTTLMGAFALQMKEIAKGREPREMDNPEFWGSAVFQGGGLGIFGDYMFADYTVYGRNPISSAIAGPMFGLIYDVGKLSIGNIQELMKGDDPKVASDIIKFAAKYNPASSIWYSRLAFERLIVNQAEMWADDKAKKRFRQHEKKLKREQNQNYWWRPGQTEPQF